jgi:malonyl-CoA O-methyltransferase
MVDLKEIGANTTLKNQKRPMEQGLVTPGRLKRVIENYETFRENDLLPATYEVLYGHAWKTQPRKKKIEQHEFSVSLDQIRK